MLINKVIISNHEKTKEYIFKQGFNLIYSEKNSKGKTTLLRAILYGLGYPIPATEGIGDFGDFTITLELTVDAINISTIRKKEKVKTIINKEEMEYLLPEQQLELHTILFKIEDFLILENLLAVFYIDQEKGWTMLNRGKIIGNNRFNIENYISGLSGKDLGDLYYEKEKINSEIKKYKYLLKIAEFKEEITDDLGTSKNNQEISDLIKERNKIIYQLNSKNKDLEDLEDIIKSNSSFAEYIETMKIKIRVDDRLIGITKKNIEHFEENENYLKYRKIDLNHQIFKLKSQQSLIIKNLEEKNKLFDIKTTLENMEENVKNLNLDKGVVENVLSNLQNQRNKINIRIKKYLSNNNSYLNYFYEIINKYAIELEIKQFIKNDHEIVLTSKLKGYSGKILTQLAFVFKLAYLKTIEEKYSVILPFIIDSPRTSEMTERAAIDMMKILKRDFPKYQIILASVYDSYGDVELNKITMETGIID